MNYNAPNVKYGNPGLLFTKERTELKVLIANAFLVPAQSLARKNPRKNPIVNVLRAEKNSTGIPVELKNVRQSFSFVLSPAWERPEELLVVLKKPSQPTTALDQNFLVKSIEE